MTKGVIIYMLFLTGYISAYEADLLSERLTGKEIPVNWLELKDQLEKTLGRELK